MDFSTLSTLSSEALTEALALDWASLSPEDVTAALTERRAEATRLFALTSPTLAEVEVASAMLASIRAGETVQAGRTQAAEEAAKRFAADRASFAASVNDGVEEGNTDENAENADAEGGDAENADAEGGDAEGGDDENAEGGDAEGGDAEGGDAEGGEGEATVTASAQHTRNQRIPAARKVGAKGRRPAAASASPTVITAASDVQGFSTGQRLSGMEEVTKALLSRTKGFAPFNLAAAKQVNAQSGGEPVIHKFGVASFGMGTPEEMTTPAQPQPGSEYAVIQAAMKARYDTSSNKDREALTAAGWCAPSENVYTFIADYVVDGLSPTPEVSAPRGGLNITTGPARSSQGTALDDFGWTQTEAQAEAGTSKPFETIVCPDFVDHRLDAIGYAYKIPLLTQKAYPEIVTDALRFADVLYAHRVNRRVIADKVALSTDLTFKGYGASFTDSLEALCILATRERRKWNIGENAVMEVEAPLIAREVYRADMSRRTGLALTDVATDQKIAAEFAARHLNVTYVADWQEVPATGNIVLPGSFKVMVYPKGTFVKATEDVVNLSAIYDAASLSVNEYTGVFFEQGYLLAKVGYGSNLVTIPINTAGETGAAIMSGLGDSHANGSF